MAKDIEVAGLEESLRRAAMIMEEAINAARRQGFEVRFEVADVPSCDDPAGPLVACVSASLTKRIG